MRAFFLPVGEGRRFCIYHEAKGFARIPLVYVHPFAEEMNLSRRMAALQARALAAAGHAVLQIDLFGCGDSDGDFVDADWPTWVGDVVAAADWLGEQTGQPPALWSLRAGCLLAAEAARRMTNPPGFLVFWQPVFSGEIFWQQFRRLGLAGDIVAGREKRSVDSSLDRGQSIEVAGYRVSPLLADGLRKATLDLPMRDGKLCCIEIAGDAGAFASDIGNRLASQRQAGWQVMSTVVAGPNFWLNPEADDCDALIAATAGLMR